MRWKPHVRFGGAGRGNDQPRCWHRASAPTPYYLHVRADHQVTSKAVVVATGVTEDGRREILGNEIGDSEDEAFLA